MHQSLTRNKELKEARLKISHDAYRRKDKEIVFRPEHMVEARNLGWLTAATRVQTKNSFLLLDRNK